MPPSSQSLRPLQLLHRHCNAQAPLNMVTDSEKLRRKEGLYHSLATIDDSDGDDTPDPGRKASEEALKKASSSSTRPVLSNIVESRKLTRCVSDSRVDNLAASTARIAEITAPPSSTAPQNASLKRARGPAPPLPTLSKSATDASKIGSASNTIGKRKRGPSAAPKPGQLQIFKDLHFFFFPNNAVHPARRMRIDKALERGAIWEQEWTRDVTHVILDSSMEFSTLLRYLQLETIPAGVAVVHESWPAECISFSTLLDPSLRRFDAHRPQALPLQPEIATSLESDDSLQVERSGKRVAKQRSQTPSRQSDSQAPRPIPLPASIIPKSTGYIADTFQVSGVKSSEEFDEAIEQAKKLQDIHLDDDDELGLTTDERQHADNSGDEHVELAPAAVPKRKKKYENPLQKFQCMEKHTGDGNDSPNVQVINVLAQMAVYYEQVKDEWRVRAYRKAIATLRNHPAKVSTREQALALPNIGERLAAKIEEIASTNRLKRLESARAEPSDILVQTFTKVYGAGVVQASRWIDQGYKTLDELLEKAVLTGNQRIGIEHFEDFNTRIPRTEVERHGDVVRLALHRIDPTFEVIIGGSYRRGSRDSGDIDLMITRPNTGAEHLRSVVLGQLIPQLTDSGFLVASLAATSHDDGSKWHGASRLPESSIWRRIDLLLVPSEELGAALIYWTGNDIVNRSLRLLASTKGMRLNQRGLYKGCLRGPGRQKITEGTLVEGRDEKKIFEILGVPWRPPEHRNP